MAVSAVAVGFAQRRRAQPHLVGVESASCPTRPRQVLVRAVRGRHRTAAWPLRDRPRRSTSSAAAVRRHQPCVTVLHMLSIRNATPLPPGPVATTRTGYCQPAATCVVDFGVDRVTLAEIARRAGVSRPTVYRRWPDARSILAALLTRHITEAVRAVPTRGAGREELVSRVVAVAERLRRRRPGDGGAAVGVGASSTSPNGWAPASTC